MINPIKLYYYYAGFDSFFTIQMFSSLGALLSCLCLDLSYLGFNWDLLYILFTFPRISARLTLLWITLKPLVSFM